MLGEGDWHVLGLEPQAVKARADFFEAFATLVAEPPSPQPRQLAELSRLIDPLPGLEVFGDPPGSENLLRFRDEEEALPSADIPAWERLGFEADAFRQAAIAALLVDTQRGLDLLRRARDRYQAINEAFATLLRAVVDRSRAIPEAAAEKLSAHYFDGAFLLGTGPLSEIEELHLALVAASASGTIDRETRAEFAGRPGARSSASFGTGAAAVFEWWAFAANLLGGAMDDPAPVERHWLATGLVHLASGHGRQLASARLDSFHWRKFAGIPDLIDLEVACAVCLTNHQLAAREEAPISTEEFEELTDVRLTSPVDARQLSLAQISLQVGVEMARRNEEPPPATEESSAPLVDA